jgi:aminoglycoside phosphotransferase (APT) family kinase protein
VLEDETLDGRELWHVRRLLVAWSANGQTRQERLIVKREVVDETGEAAVLQALEGSGLPVPSLLYVEPEDDARYLVMNQLPGQPLFTVLQSNTARWQVSAAATALAQLLARIHTLDWRSTVPWMEESGGSPIEVVRGQVERMWTQWNEAIRQAPDDLQPLFNDAQNWLEPRLPDEASLCLCHGDFSPANMLASDGEITGLVDWDRATVTDPAWDLALIPFDVYRTRMDRGDADLFMQTVLGAYSEASPLSWQNLPFFIVARLLDRALDSVLTGSGDAGLLDPRAPSLDEYVSALREAMEHHGQFPWQT